MKFLEKKSALVIFKALAIISSCQSHVKCQLYIIVILGCSRIVIVLYSRQSYIKNSEKLYHWRIFEKKLNRDSLKHHLKTNWTENEVPFVLSQSHKQRRSFESHQCHRHRFTRILWKVFSIQACLKWLKMPSLDKWNLLHLCLLSSLSLLYEKGFILAWRPNQIIKRITNVFTSNYCTSLKVLTCWW